MRTARFTAAQKIAAGYMAIALFSLVAIIYALAGMHSQTRSSEELVNRDFRALGLTRELRTNVLAQERLEQQYLILRDGDLLQLLDLRQGEFDALWSNLNALPLGSSLESLRPLVARFHEERAQGRRLLASRELKQAEAFSRKTLTPLRARLLEDYDRLARDLEEVIDSSLKGLSRDSGRAYRVTLLLLILGLALGTPVALSVILGIKHSIARLTRATQQAGAGSFDFRLEESGQDEFGSLAREFMVMGQKLRELEQLRLDANPLTHLPGNLAIQRELERRICSRHPFAHAYIDLDHFKAFSDRYGYHMGSEAIARVGTILKEETAEHGNPGDLVGHIGGDDYVVLTTPERAEDLAKAIIEHFDRVVPEFYSPEDRASGCYVGKDRFGVERTFSLMSMSIAIICSENMAFPSSQAIGQECAKMKDHLKNLPGSNYLIDRRRR